MPVEIGEYSGTTGALVGTTAVAGVTVSGSDWLSTSLTRSADGAYVVFVGVDAAAGTLPVKGNALSAGFDYNFTSANRVVARVSNAGAVDATTKFPVTAYPGSFKAAATFDGTAYWIAGNATLVNNAPQAIVYTPHGAGQSLVTVFNGSQPGNVRAGLYVSATAMQYPHELYFGRAQDQWGFVDVSLSSGAAAVNPAFRTQQGLVLDGDYNSYIYGDPHYVAAMVTNRARSQFWMVEPWLCAIYYGSGRSRLQAATTVVPSGTCVTGMALSLDETRLYFTTPNSLRYISAACTITNCPQTTVTTVTLAFKEFRGLALPPLTCSPGRVGFGCPGGVLTPCRPGTIAATAGVSSCTACGAGTYAGPADAQTSCSPCSDGIQCAGSATSNTVPCAAGSYCVAGAGPVSCSAGIYCPGGSTTNTVTCPAGYYCPGAGAAPVACPTGTWSNSTGASTSATCNACPAGSYGDTVAQTSPSCTPCPMGTFSATTSATSSATCAICATAGTYCPPGSSVNTVVCPVGWYCRGNATAMCPSGTYNANLGKTVVTDCLACGAGSFCLAGSSNTSTPCVAGYACPNVANVWPGTFACPPGFYTDGPGQTVCKTCQAGSLSSVYGATSCTTCPAGTYSESIGLALACTKCPAGTYSTTTPATSKSFWCVATRRGSAQRFGCAPSPAVP